jgi:hypothetical protein
MMDVLALVTLPATSHKLRPFQVRRVYHARVGPAHRADYLPIEGHRVDYGHCVRLSTRRRVGYAGGCGKARSRVGAASPGAGLGSIPNMD